MITRKCNSEKVVQDLPCFEELIPRTVNYLHDNWIDNNTGCGWSHYSGNDRVTEWGGTLDAIRAMVYAGESRHHPKIAKSIEWLKNSQRKDGGWLTWEMRRSCVEVTSWVLVTLKIAGEPYNSSCICNGLRFLEEAQYLNGSWGSYTGAPSRVYPTLLCIWALSGIDDKAVTRGAQWLEGAANLDGGWGFNCKDELSNGAMTSMALFALITAGKLHDPAVKEKAVQFIKACCLPEGLWEPVYEDWINFEDPETNEQLPTRTSHFTSAWAIISLIKAGESFFDPDLLKGVCALAKAQNSDGSWRYVSYDHHKHTWCTANALWALVDARDSAYNPTAYHQLISSHSTQINHLKKKLSKLTIAGTLNTFCLLITIFFTTGVLKSLKVFTTITINTIISFFTSNMSAIFVATISTVVGGGIVYFIQQKASSTQTFFSRSKQLMQPDKDNSADAKKTLR